MIIIETKFYNTLCVPVYMTFFRKKNVPNYMSFYKTIMY